MFGESLLVQLDSNTGVKPNSHNWFKFKATTQSVYVKEGTILPLLNHRNELTLFDALKNPLILQIYGE